MATQFTLRGYCDQRLAGMLTDRYSWWVHWNELATFILPRRYRWLITPNAANRGSPVNGAILNNTGTMAARTLASGMMGGITSPIRPWFQLRINGYDEDTTNPVNLWLDEVTRRIMKVMQESNFYNSLATMYMDLAVFGTAPMLIYEDYENVIHCYNPCAGEYLLACSDRLVVNVFARTFTQTVAQLVEWFGIKNVSPTTRQNFNAGLLSYEVVVGHLIEPVNTIVPSAADRFPFREIYWEVGSDQATTLRVRGYHEFPAVCPRWDITANDTYGRSPGMDALGDIKQLQQETKRKGQAIDKMVNPPLVADMQLKNQPTSSIPGGITYVNGMAGGGRPGMAPIYQVMPPIQELKEDIAEIELRIRNTFFNDLFLMISQLDTVRTATEIDERKAEKLVQLGPVLERFNNEALDPSINRIFNIMLRARLLPPPPPEIQGAPIEVNYVSMLAEAQHAASASGIERLFAFTGNLAAFSPEIADNVDFDEGIDTYATLLSVSPKLIRSRKALAGIREARQAEQEQQKAEATALAGVDAAQTLSQTPVGGGQTALQQVLEGASLPGASPI